MDQTILATKKCSKCKEEIQINAVRCKHCGADLRSWFGRHPIITIIIVLPLSISIISTILADQRAYEEPKPPQLTQEELKKSIPLDKPKLVIFWKEFSTITKEGDKNDNTVKSAVQNKSGYNLYLTMSSASISAREIADKLNNLKIPVLINRLVTVTIKNAVKSIAEAYMIKSRAYRDMANLLDTKTYKEALSQQTAIMQDLQDANTASLKGVTMIVLIMDGYEIKIK